MKKKNKKNLSHKKTRHPGPTKKGSHMTIKSLNSNLHKAGKAKKDEFYTQFADIENELKHYKDQFRGKVVFCNCDDPKESNFVKYFSMKFKDLGLKKLIATHYKDADLFTKDPSYKLEYTGNNNDNRMPDPNKFITKMIGTGDFRSEECIELLKEADIVVTNPPFSLFREYVAQLMKYNKKFLILGDQNAVTYKETFGFIKENKLWHGYDNGGIKWFQVPNNYDIDTESRIKIENGTKFFSMGRIVWYTNLETTKRYEKIVLYKKYTLKEFPKYDNYNVINVDKVADIPMNYEGVMGVPITFVDKYSPAQFEILGIANSARWIGYKCFTLIEGRKIYNRILIKRKK
jgi:hypothetical protein